MTTELKTKNAKAVISSEGAELKSLVIGGREIMWCGDRYSSSTPKRNSTAPR